MMYHEELLTIFVLVWYLFTLQEEVGEGRGGWVPFLKFTWTCVQTAWRGRATFKEWVSPPKADLVYRYCRLTFETWRQIKAKPTLNYTFCLWHICQTHPLLCYFTDSYTIIVGDFANSAYSFPVSSVCGVLCRIQLYKALHSLFKIVKVFSITVYTLDNLTWSPALMRVQ